MPDLVLVDPQRIVRAGLSLILQAQPDFRIVGEADSGVDAIALVHKHNPDLVCIAARMTDMNGLETTQRIRLEFGPNRPRIILLVGSKDGDISTAAEEAGADAVVAKYSTPESIVMGMRASLLGA